MRDNIITMSFYKETRVPVLTNSFEFVPKGRFKFLQIWMWKLLLKMNALKPFWQDQNKVERVHINRMDFAKNLWEAYGRCFPYMDRKPKKVYMGPHEFTELAHSHIDSNILRSAFTFDAEMKYNGYVFNLPITIVPHMNGVLIL